MFFALFEDFLLFSHPEYNIVILTIGSCKSFYKILYIHSMKKGMRGHLGLDETRSSMGGLPCLAE